MQNDAENLDVIPRRGLGPALFGMSIQEVEAVLGKASGSTFDDDVDERTVTLFYRGKSLFFYQTHDFRFTGIEVDQECPCSLFGEPLFPRSPDDVLALLRSNLPEEELGPIQEEKDEDLNELTLNLPSLWMTFYFDLSGSLQEVNWAAVVGPDDEIEWPHSTAPA